MFNSVVNFYIDDDDDEDEDEDEDDDEDDDENEEDDDELFLCAGKLGQLISEFSVSFLPFCLHGSIKVS